MYSSESSDTSKSVNFKKHKFKEMFKQFVILTHVPLLKVVINALMTPSLRPSSRRLAHIRRGRIPRGHLHLAQGGRGEGVRS